jgi:hypothetical protein
VATGNIRHIVIFLLKPGVEVDEVLGLLQAFDKKDPDVLEWTAAQSLDTRKGNVVIENALFANEAALARFKSSDDHNELGQKISLLADWLVADYIEPKNK